MPVCCCVSLRHFRNVISSKSNISGPGKAGFTHSVYLYIQIITFHICWCDCLFYWLISWFISFFLFFGLLVRWLLPDEWAEGAQILEFNGAHPGVIMGYEVWRRSELNLPRELFFLTSLLGSQLFANTHRSIKLRPNHFLLFQ